VSVFRPCIDLHEGRVKQIVGGTLTDDGSGTRTNFVAGHGAGWFASKFRDDGLVGGHVIKLGPGNDDAARDALAAYPGGLQLGGGITADNASAWLDAGASHVIVTSWLFSSGQFDHERLRALEAEVGRDRLVLDLSCRLRDGDYIVVIDRWQTFTDLHLTSAVLRELADHCAEYLIHGVDVEGLALGIDTDLVELVAAGSPIPATYAGGARSLDDLALVDRLSEGRVDLTIGSALDLFGGTGVRYDDAVAYNRAHRT